MDALVLVGGIAYAWSRPVATLTPWVQAIASGTEARSLTVTMQLCGAEVVDQEVVERYDVVVVDVYTLATGSCGPNDSLAFVPVRVDLDSPIGRRDLATGAARTCPRDDLEGGLRWEVGGGCD